MTVQVKRDGVAAVGVPVEVSFADGAMDSGVTDSSGTYKLSYEKANYGTALITIYPPEGVRPMEGRDVQNVDLQASPPSPLVFEMHSLEDAPTPSRDIVVGLAATALLVFLGVQAS